MFGLYLAVNALTHPYTRVTAPSATTSVLPAAVPSDGQSSVPERRERVKTFIERYTNLVGLLAIPLFSFVYYLYFRRKGLNYAEHLVANVLFAGYYTLLSLLFTLVLGLFFREYLRYLNYDLLLSELVYLTWAYFGFLSYRHPLHYLRTFTATLLALLFWAVAINAIIFGYIRYGGVLDPIVNWAAG